MVRYLFYTIWDLTYQSSLVYIRQYCNYLLITSGLWNLGTERTRQIWNHNCRDENFEEKHEVHTVWPQEKSIYFGRL